MTPQRHIWVVEYNYILSGYGWGFQTQTRTRAQARKLCNSLPYMRVRKYVPEVKHAKLRPITQLELDFEGGC